MVKGMKGKVYEKLKLGKWSWMLELEFQKQLWLVGNDWLLYAAEKLKLEKPV